MNNPKVKTIIEALVFCSSSVLKPERIKEIVKVPGKEIAQAIEELNQDYEKSERSFRIRKIAGGYQFYALSEFSSYLKELVKTKPIVLSSPSLETLAMIAYRQPITRLEIENMRGVDSTGVIRNLLEKNLVKIVGKKDVIGKPLLYGTTLFFLKHFGLNSVSELPKIEQLSDNPLKLGKQEKSNGYRKITQGNQ
ncbi:MAG: SMC-Scp complex subunit ScpB [Candidatus Omnitrophica bacterium]|nr:SMC-Scp complex subunit ScpB [Candidatus Omnitrophota bacterium]MBU1048321.1 SMC-Scp complex subunit ScpB [Candidatus Omnitrophota bacterium]MBU1630288.1 SMC-Scp complex subunit ScpB [Candidatus Omnitrophota bacterium]MBU1889697.1 SMC-Scp complex subunit ScpB [Candidatus Omnitrophota bacterium]